MKGGIDALISDALHENITQDVTIYNNEIKIKFDFRLA